MRAWGYLAGILIAIGGIASVQARSSSLSGVTVAYSHAGSVWLMNAAGGGRHLVTRRPPREQASFPRYSWSPDGRYLLVERTSVVGGHAANDVRLFGPRGGFMRSLITLPPTSTFAPTWAVDSDRIAAVTQVRAVRPKGMRQYTVESISPSGARHPLWQFRDRSGCDDTNPDPAEAVYAAETGFGGTPATLQWSTRRHLAFFSPNWCATTDMVDTRTGSIRPFTDPVTGKPFDSVRISPDGQSIVAHIDNTSAPVSRGGGDLVVEAPIDQPQYPIILGKGILPSWSADGKSVYFVRRTPGKILHAGLADGLEVSFQTYRTDVYQAVVGSHTVRHLAALDAYGTGPIRSLPGSRSLLFSVVDNDWNLWRHREASGQYTLAQLRRYGPKSRIVRLTPGLGPITIAPNSGRPAVRP